METAQSAPGPASAPDDDGAGPAVLVAASESMSSSRTTLAQEEEDEYGNNETVSHGLFAMGRCIAPPSRGEPAVSGCLIPAPSSQLWVLGRTTAVLCIEGEGTGSAPPPGAPLLPFSSAPSRFYHLTLYFLLRAYCCCSQATTLGRAAGSCPRRPGPMSWRTPRPCRTR